jgi:glycosyltransferase involved in cell wall biosynthesis
MSMHVAVSGWLLGEPSGANTRLLALLAHAGAALRPGERVTVLHRPDFVPPALAGVGWHALPIPAQPVLARVRAERRLLRAALRELGADVLDHGFLPLPPVDVPVCLLVHDVRDLDGFGRRPRWLARAVLRRSCARAAALVAPSRWTAARLHALAPHAPQPVVVANGVAVPTAPGAVTGATGPAGAPPVPANGYVLHVGHVERRKNLAVVVDALATLPAAARPELWLAGRDAGALRRLRARARARGTVVRALGVVDDALLAPLYLGARAVVVPSLHEGFGLPVLDALAHGCRVLTSDAAALPEVGGGLATVLPASDAGAWAGALAAHAERPDAGRVAAHLARFRWHDAAAQLAEVWRRTAR